MSLSRIERKEKVSYLLIKGHKEIEIAKILGVSRKTIVRDVAYLKEASHTWLEDLVKTGVIFESKLAIDKLKDNEMRIRVLLEKTDLKIEQQAKLIKQLDDNVSLQLQMLLEGPTILAMRRGMQNH